jgi:hypothetical protein
MLADIIGYIHFLVVLFIGLVPFIGNEYFLGLHLLIVPFIMLHWLTNQTVCALTELEKLVRGGGETIFGQIFEPIYKNESFIGRFMKPVYEFKDEDEETRVVWSVLTGLWVITLVRLWSLGFQLLRSDLVVLERLLHQVATSLRPRLGV